MAGNYELSPGKMLHFSKKKKKGRQQAAPQFKNGIASSVPSTIEIHTQPSQGMCVTKHIYLPQFYIFVRTTVIDSETFYQ